ncbi:YolD-like family protein [Bacillus sp. ISL-46]|uniref:YolD-like family protein n=1 Tax=Bacillus sp. ISL-46 TaxID=2819129 RepID=UPI001BE98EB3|nr:YolD-like family protein [Bacillus sp. ISL-46]MBT2722862.1 YolD-like family protein [Bacillus sp. ISL-46]
MTIRDRGKLKWQPASFLPLAFEMQREMFKDQERQARPIIDENQAEEFDQRICYAMEFNLAVKITVWDDGFTLDINGRVHYVDPITHQLRIEVEIGEYHRIALKDVVGVQVVL